MFRYENILASKHDTIFFTETDAFGLKVANFVDDNFRTLFYLKNSTCLPYLFICITNILFFCMFISATDLYTFACLL